MTILLSLDIRRISWLRFIVKIAMVDFLNIPRGFMLSISRMVASVLNTETGATNLDRGSKRRPLRALVVLFLFFSSPAALLACDTVDWSATVDPGANLSPTEDAPLEATCGLLVGVDGVNPAYLVDNTPATITSPPITQYLARFYLIADELVLGADDELLVFAGVNSADEPLFDVIMGKEGDSHHIKLIAYNNDGSQVNNIDREARLPAGWRALQVEWKAATADASFDGFLNLTLDGVAAGGLQNLNGLDNDTQVLDSVQLGAVNGDSTSASAGSFKLDAFVSYRDGDGGLIDKNCSGNTVSIEHMTFLPGSKTCVGTTSVSTGEAMTIDSGADVTLISPAIHLQAGFSVPVGASFRGISP